MKSLRRVVAVSLWWTVAEMAIVGTAIHKGYLLAKD
jgi:hypothetical protein